MKRAIVILYDGKELSETEATDIASYINDHCDTVGNVALSVFDENEISASIATISKQKSPRLAKLKDTKLGDSAMEYLSNHVSTVAFDDHTTLKTVIRVLAPIDTKLATAFSIIGSKMYSVSDSAMKKYGFDLSRLKNIATVYNEIKDML